MDCPLSLFMKGHRDLWEALWEKYTRTLSINHAWWLRDTSGSRSTLISNPLLVGFFHEKGDGNKLWIQFKYERLKISATSVEWFAMSQVHACLKVRQPSQHLVRHFFFFNKIMPRTKMVSKIKNLNLETFHIIFFFKKKIYI